MKNTVHGDVLYNRCVGEGAFGDVHLCSKSSARGDKVNVAIKRFFIRRGNKNTGIVNIRELDYMVSPMLKHPYILASSKVWLDEVPFDSKPKLPSNEMKSRADKLYIEMPAANMDLLELIEQQHKPQGQCVFTLSYPHCKRIMYQVMSAIYHMHSYDISHRDIKPNNILCFFSQMDDATGTYAQVDVKLTDFGMCKHMKSGERNTSHIGTHMYNAPEVISNKYDKSIDIWAAGLCFYELVSKGSTFLDGRETEYDKIVALCKILGIPDRKTFSRVLDGTTIQYDKVCATVQSPSNIDSSLDRIKLPNPAELSSLKDLLRNMIVFDPLSRMSAWECLNHPYFNSVRNKPNGVILQREITSSDHDYVIGEQHWSEAHLRTFTNIKNIVCDSRLSIQQHIMPIIFHTLDIYMRTCQYIHEVDHTSSISKKYITYLLNSDHSNIIAACFYIVFKYYYNTHSPPCTEIQKCMNSTATQRVMETIEKRVLYVIKYRTFRYTVYELLPKDHHHKLDTILDFMLTNKNYHQYTVMQLVEVFT